MKVKNQDSALVKEQRKRRMKTRILGVTRNWQLYVFLLLPVLYIFVFKYIPMGGLVIAFKDFKARLGIWESKWVGFDHFERFFTTYQSKRVITNTLLLSLYSIIAGFPLPIIFALLINCIRNEKFKKVTQSIVCLPHFISTVVIVGILFQIFNNRSGLYGQLGELITGEYPEDIFGSGSAFRNLYVWSGVWKGFGWGSIIYTAALSGVDPTYHEAAQLDGASRFQRIIHVDLPAIMPTIIIMLILRLGDVMSIGFEKVFLMQNDLNLGASEVISTYEYSVGLSGTGTTNFSYSTAIGMFNSVVNLIMVVLANKISRKVSDTSLW